MRDTTLGEALAEAGGSIKTGPFGTVLKAAEYSQEGAPVISVGEVGYGELRVTSRTPRVSRAVVDRLPEYQLRMGDIVFGRKGAVDRSAWLRPHEDGYFLGSDGIRVRVAGPLSSRFLAYQLSSNATRDWLIQHASGTTMASLNQRTLERVPLRLPDLQRQQAIAEVLGALDDKIAANAKLVETADQLASALVRQHASSQAVPLSDFAVVTMGSSPPGSSYNESGEGIPFFQGIRDFGVRYPSQRVWTSAPVRLAQQDDTLLSVRAPVGRVNRSRGETCIGRGLASVRSLTGQPMTLFHLLRESDHAWAPYEAEGTVFGSINKTQLNNVEIKSVAPERAATLEQALVSLEDRITSALSESEVLATTRDSLLPGLMSGKIAAKDAERTAEEVL